MNHKNISDSFILSNFNTPEKIIDAFTSGAYGTDRVTTLYKDCENIALSDDDYENKINRLKETINIYHISLYKP